MLTWSLSISSSYKLDPAGLLGNQSELYHGEKGSMAVGVSPKVARHCSGGRGFPCECHVAVRPALLMRIVDL